MIRKQPIRRGLAITATLLLAALWVTVSAADSIPPQINMNVRTDRYEPGVIKTYVNDDTEVAAVKLFYRNYGESYYNSIDMKRENDVYYQELDRELGLDGTVEYYLLAQDTSGNQTTEPRLDPENNPMSASAGSMTSVSAQEVSLTNPEAGTVLDNGSEPIMITFYVTERDLDFNTMRFKIDQRDRTREVEFFGNVLLWEPKRPLADGYHEIEVIVRDTRGDYVGPNIWTFQVKTKRELPLGAEGDFYVGIQRDDRSGTGHSVPLWNNKIDFNLKGQTGPFNWTGGVMLSSEETSFLTSESLPDRQPINRFFFDGRTRNFRLRFGDSNPNFSELTMKGILVRGINLEFKSNRFQAGIVRGYNKREINEQVEIVDPNVTPDATDPAMYFDENGEQKMLGNFQRIIQDPVSGRFHVYEFLPGTFKRDVTAAQMDVVPIKNRIATWKFGVNLFAAEDDSTSLSYNTVDGARYYSYRDSLFSTDYKPMKNWAGTFETSLRFWDNRSEIAAEFGGTMATENLFSPIPDEIKDELPEDIDDDLFRFNATTQTSFDKKKISDNISKGATDAIKSVYKIRLMTPVPIPQTSTNFKGELYRIPTHYISLGNPQQKTDIGGYKFDIRSRFLKDQLTVNLGYDVYADNLDSERKQFSSEDGLGNGAGSKDLTKDTSIANFSVTATPRILPEYQPTVTLGFRNYNAENNLDQNIAANRITDMVNTTTNTVMLTLGATLPVKMQKHTGTLSFTNMDIEDNRPLDSYLLNESSNVTVMFNVNSAINPMPLTINTSIGRTDNAAFRPVLDDNQNPYDRKEMTTGITIMNIAGTYKWFRDKRLGTTVGVAYLGSSNDESDMYKVDNTKTSLRLEADYRLTSVMSCGASFRYNNYTDNANDINDYTEPIFGINLRSTF